MKRTGLMILNFRLTVWLILNFVGLLWCSTTLHAQTAEGEAPFSLPTVPDSLRTPSARAGFIVDRFWDDIDFQHDARLKNEQLFESHFVDFLYICNFADSESQTGAIDRLFEKSNANPSIQSTVTKLAEKYLYEFDSPMYDEALFEKFANRCVKAEGCDEKTKLRYSLLLDDIAKNRPGSSIADFEYISPDGSSLSIGSSDFAGDLVILFYDPQCEHCLDVIAKLQHDDLLTSKMLSGEVQILALYSGDDHEMWLQSASLLPDAWLKGYEDGEMQEDERFILRSMPTFYVVDRNKRVVLKDANLNRLQKWLDADRQ